jgi:hypothetical protein
LPAPIKPIFAIYFSLVKDFSYIIILSQESKICKLFREIKNAAKSHL